MFRCELEPVVETGANSNEDEDEWVRSTRVSVKAPVGAAIATDSYTPGISN